jgi:hypothetical protein
MTTAFVKTRPVPSTNVPNLMTLVAARAAEDVAMNKRTINTLALRMSPPEIFRDRAVFSNSIGATEPRIRERRGSATIYLRSGNTRSAECTPMQFSFEAVDRLSAVAAG